MVERCLVSSVEHVAGLSKQGKSYDFVMLRYVRIDSLVPSASPDGNSRGIKFKEVSLDSVMYSLIPQAPAVYDIEFGYVTVRGEEKLMPISFSYVNSFSDYFTAKKDKA